MKALFPVFLLSLMTYSLQAQKNGDLPSLSIHVSPDIRLNQVGFYPAGEKVAVITGNVDSQTGFYIATPALTDTLFSGRIGEQGYDAASSKTTHTADFSAFKDTGTFVLLIPGLGYSYPFRIGRKVYGPLAASSLKAFYFQRASTSLEEPYAL